MEIINFLDRLRPIIRISFSMIFHSDEFRSFTSRDFYSMDNRLLEIEKKNDISRSLQSVIWI